MCKQGAYHSLCSHSLSFEFNFQKFFFDCLFVNVYKLTTISVCVHQRVREGGREYNQHILEQKSSSICKHYLNEHNSDVPPFLSEQFHMLTKGSNKFDCLIKEMLFIRKLKPSLNVQADSIRAKVFT